MAKRAQPNEYPKPSTQESGHGYQPMAVPQTSPFHEVPMEPLSVDGYGAEDSPQPPAELGHQAEGDGYSSKPV